MVEFPFLADKVEKAADSDRDCGKYDIYIISRISNLHKYNGFPYWYAQNASYHRNP